MDRCPRCTDIIVHRRHLHMATLEWVLEWEKAGAGGEGAYADKSDDKSENPACGQKRKLPPTVRSSAAKKGFADRPLYVDAYVGDPRDLPCPAFAGLL